MEDEDFYHLFMEDEEWLTDRLKVHDVVARLLALLDDGRRNRQS